MQVCQPPTYLPSGYSSTAWSLHPGLDSLLWTSRISIYAPPWQGMSTCNWNSPTCRKTSLHITTCSTLQHPTGTSIAKSTRACTAPASGDHCPGDLGKKAEGTQVKPKQNNARTVDPWVAPNHFFSCCQQLWGKIHQGRTRSAPDTSGAEILYALVQKGRGKISRTYHQMGLCQQVGAPFNAIVCLEGIEAVPASPTYRTTRSAAPACQKDKWHKSPTCKPTQ